MTDAALGTHTFDVLGAAVILTIELGDIHPNLDGGHERDVRASLAIEGGPTISTHATVEVPDADA